MKKLNRMISLLLTVCFVLGSVAGLSVVGVSAAEDTSNNIDLSAIDYVNTVYYTPEDKLATMKMAFEKGDYQLWVNDFTGEVTTVNTKTGEMLFSNPYDVGLSKAVTSLKSEFLSQIIIGYTGNDSTMTNTFNSYTDAALNDQIKVKNIKNGIRVEYTIGREETNYLVPRLIPADRFEEFFGETMRQAMADEGREWYYEKRFLTFFSKRDPAEVADSDRKLSELYAELPITQKIGAVYQINGEITPAELMQLEEYIKTYVSAYTYEELDMDHEKTEYVNEDQNPAVFKLALEYILDELGMTVTLPANGIRFDESLYQLSYITILPYMGAGTYSEFMPNTGYTFLPDGSGAIFRFEDLANGGTVSGQVYGQDYAYHTITGKYQETIRMPVYGVVRDNLYSYVKNTTNDTYVLTENVTPTSSGFFAIIEEGDALSTIKTYHLGKSAEYHTTQVTVNPRPSDSYNLADSISVGSNSTWTVVSDRKYVGNYTIRYIMLTDDKVAAERGITDYYPANYFGMATAYQDYLASPYSTGTQNLPVEQQTSVLKRLGDSDVESTIPLTIETFGTLETIEKILSIPVNVMAPLTTFEDIVTMYEEMSEYGNITNINFKLTGYANGGMYNTVPYGLKWEKAVGGKKGFEELLAYAAKINSGSTADGKALEIFPDFDFVYTTNIDSFDGFSIKKHAVKTIDDRYTMKSTYSSTMQTREGYGQLLISPAYFSRFYEELTSNYTKYLDEANGISALNISAATLGTDLNSDFDEDEPYNREDNKKFTVEALKHLADNYNKVMVEGGNVYSWQYVDYIVGLSIDSSRYLMASNTIPFAGIVLHGYKQYTGTAINEEGNIQYGILKAIESGSSLYFVLTYQNATKLKEDYVLSRNYSVRYDIWAGAYNEEGEFETGELVDLYHQLNDAIADVQNKKIVGHTLVDGWRIPDEDELIADEEEKIQKELADAEAERIATEARLRKEHLEARISVVNNATISLNTAKQRIAGVQIEKILRDLETAMTKRANALEALKTATEEEIAVHEKAINDAEKTIQALYNANIMAAYTVIEGAYNTVMDKQRLLSESIEFFKADGTYAEEFIADVQANVEPVAAIVAEATEIMETMKSYRQQVVDAAAGLIVEPEAVEEEISEEFMPAKYKLDDGSIVAVTYGEVGAPYKTFLLNYNYFDVIVEYEGTTYEIDAYGYAVIQY
jgi:hypothetical protein